jgi:hypothetical protein
MILLFLKEALISICTTNVLPRAYAVRLLRPTSASSMRLDLWPPGRRYILVTLVMFNGFITIVIK